MYRKAFQIRNHPYFDKKIRNTGGVHMEVTPRFELGNEGFADPCLTTWLCHHIRETAFSGRFSVWSGRRGSNSLPRPWQGRALPDELRPQAAPLLQRLWCLRPGSNRRHADFQSAALPTELPRHIKPLLQPDEWRPGRGSNPRPPA